MRTSEYMTHFEYKGKVYVLQDGPFSMEEIWFIVKNYEHVKHEDVTLQDMHNYARLWSATKKHQCVFGDPEMSMLNKMKFVYS
jgi:hypothetical protein